MCGQVLVLLKMELPHDDPHNVFGAHAHRTAVLQGLKLTGGDHDARATSE
jgi:hypothetical protein